MHLVRLAPGSRRRYCRDCGSRWIGAEKVFSPWARLAGILLFCLSAARALVYLKDEGWFEARPYAGRSAWEGPRTGTTDGNSLAGIETSPEDDAYSQYPGAGGPLEAIRFTRRNSVPLNWREGRVMELLSTYSQGSQAAGQQGRQFQEMQELLRRVAATGKTPQQLASEIDSTDKQTLWNKYGANFSSKEEAKAAYNDFKSHRSEIPNDLPRATK